VGDHIISFFDICAMRGQLVLAKAPSIPAINNKTVYCTGAHKHGEDRCIVLDGEEYSQIFFVKGWTNAMPKTNEAKKATCTNVRTA
jgi:hypothetical protein